MSKTVIPGDATLYGSEIYGIQHYGHCLRKLDEECIEAYLCAFAHEGILTRKGIGSFEIDLIERILSEDEFRQHVQPSG